MKQKTRYNRLWQLAQKDTREFAVGYWDNKPPSSKKRKAFA